jgi:peptidoglycan/LPS O-acetylase OafA/YrhL
VHYPFGARLLMVTHKLGVEAQWLMCVLIVVCAITIILLAWIFYQLVEKPAMGLAKRAAAR